MPPETSLTVAVMSKVAGINAQGVQGLRVEINEDWVNTLRRVKGMESMQATPFHLTGPIIQAITKDEDTDDDWLTDHMIAFWMHDAWGIMPNFWVMELNEETGTNNSCASYSHWASHIETFYPAKQFQILSALFSLIWNVSADPETVHGWDKDGFMLSFPEFPVGQFPLNDELDLLATPLGQPLFETFLNVIFTPTGTHISVTQIEEDDAPKTLVNINIHELAKEPTTALVNWIARLQERLVTID